MPDANVNNHTPVATSWAIAAWLIWFAQIPILLVGVPRATVIFADYEVQLPLVTIWLISLTQPVAYAAAMIDNQVGGHVGAVALAVIATIGVSLVVIALRRSKPLLVALSLCGIVLVTIELAVILIPMARLWSTLT